MFKNLYSDDIQSYLDRLQELREDAIDENIEVNENSVAGFRKFLNSAPYVVRGGLFLMENGNLRATWNVKAGDHVGLEFLDYEKVIYVAFKYHEDGSAKRNADYIAIKDIFPLLKEFELDFLLTDAK